LRKILNLTGWGQKFDSLEEIFKDQNFDPIFFEKFSISSFNYFKFTSFCNFLEIFKTKIINPDIVIGWSLGGQLACRLIESKIINPKLLILIAPPFQMVKDNKIQAGMSKNTFDEFYNNFTKAPDKTLKQFAILTAMNDTNSTQIAKNLDISNENFNSLKFWLEELGRFSSFDINFDNFPKTIFFQGLGDMIVHQKQSEYFRERIANFSLFNFKNCGHAPHLNNPSKFSEIILEFIEKI
jgi:pimeloyl-ACP methyl ester carboxylesterase